MREEKAEEPESVAEQFDDDDEVARLEGADQHPSMGEEETEEPEPVAEQFDLDLSWFEERSEYDEAESEEPEAEQPPRERYTGATTQEYEELAKAVDEADAAGATPQAASVVMPGLDHGVLGFEDVTGAEVEPEQEEQPDLLTRLASGGVLAAAFLVALFVGQPVALAALVLIAALVSVLELYTSIRRAGFNPMVLIGLLGSAAVVVGAWVAGSEGPYAASALAAGTIAVLMLWYVLTGMRRPLENGALTLLGVLWIAFLLSLAMPILSSPDYQPLVLFIVAVSATLDIGAYFVGRGLGRTRLAPTLSPTKTVEGLLGGAVLALGIGAGLTAFSFFEVLDLTQALVLVAVVLVFSPLGDLTESLVKRSLGVKDMGSILPGHGGLLDRIDGLIFVLPASYFALWWMGIL